MILRRFQIENFRGIEMLTVDLDRITVLIGENNTGKTSVLEALHICMNRGLSRRGTPFTEYDFYLANETAQPSDAPPIGLTLTFEEEAEGEWVPEIDQAFDRAVQVLNDNRKRIAFRVTAAYDKSTRDFAIDWAFLDLAGNPLPTAKQPKLVTDLQSLAPVFLLAAVREASQHFHAKASFWSPFTKNPQIDDETRKVIEAQIAAINQSVLDSHKPFEVVKDRVAQAGKLLPLATQNLVSVEAVPARVFDMLARTQVKLATRTGARLPIAQHGAGTQSLSVLFLFEAFLQSRLAEAYDQHSEPILALEEPESHLHPSAIRALWSTLEKFAGQKIVATHSGDLLGVAPLMSIRRLARKQGKVHVFRVNAKTLDATEAQKVTYHIRAKRGALFFARCWLFVEGETDFTVLPEFARLLGHDFQLAGISCVEFAQCGLAPLIKVAKDLGIDWHVLTDGDKAGADTAKTASGLLGSDPSHERITKLAETDIEHCLWHAGYSAVYEAEVDAQHKKFVTAKPGDADYPTQTIKAAAASTSKPYLAYAVISAAEKKGSPGVPTGLKIAIEAVFKLAANCA
jgi:putative ATP-dependent endonuclease of the OLD family